MATNRWLGGALGVPQVDTIQIASYHASTTYKVTINGKVVSVPGDTDVATTAADLQAALDASEIPEFAEITWAVVTDTITATGPADGAPVTITTSVSGGTGTIMHTTVTTASGPNDWNTAANWSLGYVPQSALTPNQSITVSAVAGGSLADNTYYYKVTSLNHNGETDNTTQEGAVITSGSDNSVHLSWPANPLAMSFKIYRGTTTNTENKLVATVVNTGGTVTSYTDVGAATTNVSPPGSNTAVGDDVVLEYGTYDIKYDLDQNTVILASLTTEMGYIASQGVGLPEENPLGYIEYRPTFLKIQVPGTVPFGNGIGGGVPMFKLDLASSAAAITINNTGKPSQQGLEALLLRGLGSGSSLNIYRGSACVNPYAGDTSSLSGGLNIGYVSNVEGDVSLRIGAGCTISSGLTMTGGSLDLFSTVSGTWLQKAGEAWQRAGTLATVKLQGGILHQLGTGTVISSACTIGPGAWLDLSQDLRAKTITPAITVYAGGKLTGDKAYVTYTGGFTVPNGTLADVEVDVGQGRTYVIS